MLIRKLRFRVAIQCDEAVISHRSPRPSHRLTTFNPQVFLSWTHFLQRVGFCVNFLTRPSGVHWLCLCEKTRWDGRRTARRTFLRHITVYQACAKHFSSFSHLIFTKNLHTESFLITPLYVNGPRAVKLQEWCCYLKTCGRSGCSLPESQ